MGITDFFKKPKPKGPDVTRDLILKNLKPGYFVDYDMQSWQVTALSTYEWGENDVTREWQLKSPEFTAYLEMESDDEEEWSFNRKIPFSRLGAGIKEHILQHGDPPDEIMYDGERYYLEDTAGGHFFKDGEGIEGQPLLRWGYENEDGEKYLGIEQWGEEEFEASTGIPVQEYQFSNILPGNLE